MWQCKRLCGCQLEVVMRWASIFYSPCLLAIEAPEILHATRASVIHIRCNTHSCHITVLQMLLPCVPSYSLHGARIWLITPTCSTRTNRSHHPAYPCFFATEAAVRFIVCSLEGCNLTCRCLHIELGLVRCLCSSYVGPMS